MNIRYRKQVAEILHFFNRHRGKEYDFLHDETYDLAKTKLIELATKAWESREANEGYNLLPIKQQLEDRELYGKIDELMLNQSKVLTLREEFFAQEEAANARIEKFG